MGATCEDTVAKKKSVGSDDANAEHVGYQPEPAGKKKRATEPAQLAADLVAMGNLVADHYGTTIGKLFDPQLRPWLTPLYARVLKEKMKNLPPELGGGG